MPTILSYSDGSSIGHYDLHAHKCFWLGILGPIMIVLLAIFGCLVAAVTSATLGMLLPRHLAISIGVVIAAVFCLCVPVAGFFHGIIALHRFRTRNPRNRWQVFLGLTLHSMLIAVIVYMLYRCLW